MCGRFTMAVSKQQLRDYLREHYNIDEIESTISLPHYNISPGQNVICIISDGVSYRAGDIEWGYISPFGSHENRLINARSETVHEKPTFVQSFTSRRCIIVADGFYEWSKNKNSREPMRIQLQSEELFGFAGIWTKTVMPEETKYTCAILTTSANSLLESLHDRMPVILNEEDAKIWMNPAISNEETLTSILRPFPPEELKLYQVSSVVNSTKVNTVECIKRKERE